MDRVELGLRNGDRKGEECGSLDSVGAVAEIAVIPMRAEAADYHTKTRNSLTSHSVIALSSSGISFSTIV